MITENSHTVPPLSRLLGKVFSTAIGALENRGELLIVEVQEERYRIIQLAIRGVGALFLGMMGVLLLTGTIIFVVPSSYRVYAAAGFTVLYIAGSIAGFMGLKSLLKQAPFAETLAQFRKDRTVADAFHD